MVLGRMVLARVVLARRYYSAWCWRMRMVLHFEDSVLVEMGIRMLAVGSQ